MNTTTPRFAAATFAFMMTLAMLLGVGGLADHSQASVQMAQAVALHNMHA